MSETVKFWIKNFQDNDVTVVEEIEDIKSTIKNEELWAKGSSSKEEEEMHLQNIAELKEYLEWLKEQRSKNNFMEGKVNEV